MIRLIRLALDAEDDDVARRAEAGRALRHRVQYLIEVGWHSRDGAQDLAGGGLLVSRDRAFRLGALHLGRQRRLALAQGGVLIPGRRVQRPQLLKLRLELVNGGSIVGHGGARIARAPSRRL